MTGQREESWCPAREGLGSAAPTASYSPCKLCGLTWGPAGTISMASWRASGTQPRALCSPQTVKNGFAYFLGLVLCACRGCACVVLVAEWAGFGGLPHAKCHLHFAGFLRLLLWLSQWSRSPCAGLGRVPDPLRHRQSYSGSRWQAPGIEGVSSPCGYHVPALCWARRFPSLYPHSVITVALCSRRCAPF